MKALAYLLFVISVLLVSGFARADMFSPYVQQTSAKAAPVDISQVTVDQSHTQLLIAGALPTPCHPQPYATLILDETNPTTLIVQLSSPLPSDMCVQRIKPYSTLVDLPGLVQAEQLDIDESAVYEIKTEGFDFQTQVRGADLIRR